MPQVNKSLLQALLNPTQRSSYLLHRLTVVIDTQLHLKLFPHQEQMLLYLEHQLLNYLIHILHNILTTDIPRYLLYVLTVQCPL
jgi:hypothetical protein